MTAAIISRHTLARFRAALGPDPSPLDIVTQAATAAAAWRARMVAAGAADKPGSGALERCSSCGGMGIIETDDGRGAWCTAPECRYGYVRTSDVAARGCSRCQGAGVTAEIVDGERTGLSVMCSCSAAGADRITMARLQAAGMPVKYRGMTLSTWQQLRGDSDGALSDARRLAGGGATLDGRPGLLLMGLPGRGKSGLAAGIMDARVSADPSAAWISWGTWSDQLNDLRAAGASVTEAIRRASAASCLIIDDLGAEGGATDWRIRVLLDVLETRERGQTVITTTLGVDDVAARYGDHIAGRIVELCRPALLSGANLRIGG